jgi:SagB-type dehydrogenase family enzyme
MHPTPVPMTAPAPVGDLDIHDHLVTLRQDPMGVNPDGWRIDWDDGPWPVKVYTGARRIQLDSGGSELARLGRVLLRTFAVSRVRFDPRGGLPSTPDSPGPARRRSQLITRRPIPSGGSMYPTEAYLLFPQARSAYHYDPYRHELTELGTLTPRRLCGLSGLSGGDEPLALLVLTNRFWKNYYKYGDFAFRLGAVDVGVALGRAVRLAHAEFGRVTVHTDFDDAELNACLALDPQDECGYAVVTIGAAAPHPATVLGRQIALGPPTVIERSRHVKRSQQFATLVAASCMPATRAPQPIPAVAAHARAERLDAAVVRLPFAPPVDLLDHDTMLRRTSNGALFTGGLATGDALAAVLRHTADGLSNLRRIAGGHVGGDVELRCAVHRVDGVPPGWYRYRERTHDLIEVGAGRGEGSARELQKALLADSINVELAAFTVHLTGRTEYRYDGRGARGYREQQLAIGAGIEAVTLLAEAVGLGSHPLLGFDAGAVDRAYGLTGTGRGVHAQVCVGAVRPDLNWEITVVPR